MKKYIGFFVGFVSSAIYFHYQDAKAVNRFRNTKLIR